VGEEDAIKRSGRARGKEEDYYELLQLSRNAHPLMLTKAYRLLAALYHPDNRDTGDTDKFLKLTQAYRVLSDPIRREAYDRATFGVATPLEVAANGALSAAGDPNVENENQLRQSLLQVLYQMRRNYPQSPGLSLTTLAELLGCSIDLMQFTLWYLRGKKFIDTVDDGNVAITVLGVDHIEATAPQPSAAAQMLSVPPHEPQLAVGYEADSAADGASR
jgi:curved DNA-binding protein